MEGAFQNFFGYLKTDEVVIRLGGVVAARHLQDVEAELHSQVRSGIVGIGDRSPEFPGQLGVFERHRTVHGNPVALGVGGVVGQSAQREGILVEVLRFANHVEHKIAAAHIVHQIAEEFAAERIIPHVLDDAAGVGVGVGLNQIFGGGLRPTFKKQRLDVLVPSRIDDGFVGENGIALQRGTQQQQRRTTSGRPVHTIMLPGSAQSTLCPASHPSHHIAAGV